MRGAAALFSMIIFLGLAATANAAQVQDQQQKLNELETDIKKSQELRDKIAEEADAARIEIEAITNEMVTRTKSIMVLEDSSHKLEDEITALESDLDTREADLIARRGDMAKTLAALQRLSDRPSETVLLQPGNAVDTVRSATLLSTTLPEIKQRAQKLREDITAINRLRIDLQQRKDILTAQKSSIRSQQNDLEKLLRGRKTKRRSLLKQADVQDDRIKRLASEAKNLRDLIARLEKDAIRTPNDQPLPPAGSFFKAKGKLPYPVSGRLVGRYGEKTQTGRTKGLRIRTNDKAPVIAPFDGRVVYAGVYRSYGQILIIAHGAGYHSLLAGLERIDGQVGQSVLAGEPVGITGQGGAGAGAAELYIEIRKGGVPINPNTWFAGKDLKGRKK